MDCEIILCLYLVDSFIQTYQFMLKGGHIGCYVKSWSDRDKPYVLREMCLFCQFVKKKNEDLSCTIKTFFKIYLYALNEFSSFIPMIIKNKFIAHVIFMTGTIVRCHYRK